MYLFPLFGLQDNTDSKPLEDSRERERDKGYERDPSFKVADHLPATKAPSYRDPSYDSELPTPSISRPRIVRDDLMELILFPVNLTFFRPEQNVKTLRK